MGQQRGNIIKNLGKPRVAEGRAAGQVWASNNDGGASSGASYVLPPFHGDDVEFNAYQYHERAAIMEYDGGLPREEAESKAYKETCEEWIIHNSTGSMGICPGCGTATSRDDIASWGGLTFHQGVRSASLPDNLFKPDDAAGAGRASDNGGEKS